MHGQKVVATRRRLYRVSRDFDIAIGAVFKAYGRGQTRGQFAVDLAFGGACADGTPTDQVTDVLG